MGLGDLKTSSQNIPEIKMGTFIHFASTKNDVMA